MSESQISKSPTVQPHPHQESDEVSDSWQQMMQGVLASVLLLGALLTFRYYAQGADQGTKPSDLEQRVHELNAEVQQLRQEQAMPAVVLSRYRNSIGYIYGVYQVG